MVVGARTRDLYRGSALKAPLCVLLKWLVKFTSGKRIPDVNLGYRLFDRRAAMRYDRHLCNTFSFTTSLTMAYEMKGKCTGYLPIPYRAPVEGTKVRLLRDSLRTLQYITQAGGLLQPVQAVHPAGIRMFRCRGRRVHWIRAVWAIERLFRRRRGGGIIGSSRRAGVSRCLAQPDYGRIILSRLPRRPH